MGRPAWGSQGAIRSKLGASHGTRRHTPGLPVFWSGHVLSPWTASGELFSSSPGRGRSFVCNRKQRTDHGTLAPRLADICKPSQEQALALRVQLLDQTKLPPSPFSDAMLLQAPTGLSSGPAEPRPLLNYWWINPPTRSATAKKRAKIGASERSASAGPSRLFSTVTRAKVAATPLGFQDRWRRSRRELRDERVSNLQRGRIRRGAKRWVAWLGAVTQCFAVGLS